MGFYERCERLKIPTKRVRQSSLWQNGLMWKGVILGHVVYKNWTRIKTCILLHNSYEVQNHSRYYSYTVLRYSCIYELNLFDHHNFGLVMTSYTAGNCYEFDIVSVVYEIRLRCRLTIRLLTQCLTNSRSVSIVSLIMSNSKVSNCFDIEVQWNNSIILWLFLCNSSVLQCGATYITCFITQWNLRYETDICIYL